MNESPSATIGIDKAFLEITRELEGLASRLASESVKRILDVSSSFLSEEAHSAITAFYDLYFGSAAAAQGVNDDVDRIIEETQRLIESGASVDQLPTASVDSDIERSRLAISGLQKRLEVVISLEEGFRERLAPVLGSLQFEDAMTQRLKHVEAALEQTVDCLSRSGEPDFSGVAQLVEQSLSSDDERRAFYLRVLREEPPPSAGDRGGFIDFGD